MKSEIKKALISSHSLEEASMKIFGDENAKKREYIKNFEKGMSGKLATGYHSFWKVQKDRTLRIIKKFNTASSFLKSPNTIIDLGCGTGTFLIELAKKCKTPVRYIGIDKSPDMIKIAKKQLQESNLPNEIKKCFTFYVKGVGTKDTYELIKKVKPGYITSVQLFHQTKNSINTIAKIINVSPKNTKLFLDDLDRSAKWVEKRKRLLYLVDNFINPYHGIRTHMNALSKKEVTKICKESNSRICKVSSNKWSKNEDSHWTILAVK